MIDQRTKTVFEFRGLAVFRLVTKNVDRRIHSEKKYYKAETWCRRRAQSCPLVYGPFRLNRVQLLETSSPQTWSNLQVWSFVRLHKRPQYHGIHWHTHFHLSVRGQLRTVASVHFAVKTWTDTGCIWIVNMAGNPNTHRDWPATHTHCHTHTLTHTQWLWHWHTHTLTHTHARTDT